MTGGGTPARVLALGLYRGSKHGPEKRVSCVGMWIPEPRADFYRALVLCKCFVGEFNLCKDSLRVGTVVTPILSKQKLETETQIRELHKVKARIRFPSASP